MNIKNLNFFIGASFVFCLLFVGCSQDSASPTGNENPVTVQKDPYLVTEYPIDIVGDYNIGQGVVSTADGGWMAVGRTGRVLSIWKFSAEGVLDASFSGDGILSPKDVSTIVWDKWDSLALDIVNTPDGGWLVAGGSTVPGYQIMLLKVTPTGVLDTSFNNGNILGVSVGYEDYGTGVTRTSDGAWIAVGSTKASQIDPERMFAVKISDSGSIDTSFATQGVFIDGAPRSVAHSVTATADGGWVIAGDSLVSGGNYLRATLWKFTDTGELDNSFYGNGVAVSGVDIDEGGENYTSSARSVTASSDGGWIVTGSIGQKPRMAIWKFNAKNELQTGVFNNGVYIDKVESVNIQAGGQSIATTSDGGWVVAGYSGTGIQDMAMWKFTSNGELDSALDGDGFFTQNYASGGSENDIARGVTSTKDGGWVAIGATDIALASSKLSVWKFNQ